jgi:hypothetical protein
VNITLGDFFASKAKWVEAKAAYEKANNREKNQQDSRTMLALGNMYFATLSAKRDENLKLSYKFYHHVLNKDHLSIFPAIGLGIVCAEKKLFEIARDIFSRVKSHFVIVCHSFTSFSKLRIDFSPHFYNFAFRSVNLVGRPR